MKLRILTLFLVQLGAYSLFVVVYFASFLNLIGGWLKDLFVYQREVYVAASILLMAAQSIGLDRVTDLLAKWTDRNS
ncbi:MAG: hypothetical protein JOY96_08260 [Verrucomicrobia bacterium]|nr:hypothetical protein [Verrucomicrobiota bacterium]MBV9672589.1 hypothetical protein [Verrucomicrobiota bacterium]